MRTMVHRSALVSANESNRKLRAEIERLRADVATHKERAAAREKERDRWHGEYENLAKFATQFERERDEARERAERFRQERDHAEFEGNEHRARADRLAEALRGLKPDTDPDPVALQEIFDDGGLVEVYRAGQWATYSDALEAAALTDTPERKQEKT